MRCWSRLSGGEMPAAPGSLVPDLFEIGDAGPSPRVRLVPDCLATAVPVTFMGRWPEARDLEAVARVIEPLSGVAVWSAWAQALPVVANVGDRVRLQPLDEEILAHLSHLQHVCHRPRLHLRIDEERVSVSRARRIAPRAVAWLASHPGDWERRTLKSVRPARVVASVVEDEWNLYENRVTVRLVDHLLEWVGGRLEELRQVEEMEAEGEEFLDEARGSRWRGGRLFELWGQMFAGNSVASDLQRTIVKLEGAYRDLQALLDSPLYREVPRTMSVSVALRPTNILVNDPHYRKIAALWRSWARAGHVRQPTREELRRRREAECQRFDEFARLIVVRALDGLGYEPREDTSFSDAGAIELVGPLGPACLRISGGRLTLEVGTRALRLVPVLASLAKDSTESMWQQIRSAADPDTETLVFVLGRLDALKGAAWATARALSGWGSPRVVPISPWSLDVVERVARVIRGWEAPHRLGGYPLRSVVRPDPMVVLPSWLRRIGNDIGIVAPADAKQRDELHQACARRRSVLLQDPRNPAPAQALDALMTFVDRAEDLVVWRSCPVCEKRAGVKFELRPGSASDWKQWSWWCRCAECSSEWGLRVCGGCQASSPVMIPYVHRAHGDAPEEVGWVDRCYGRDLWAEPCWNPSSEKVFRCSQCGRCPVGVCSHCRS